MLPTGQNERGSRDFTFNFAGKQGRFPGGFTLPNVEK
jgi:hypothetical protein